MTMALLFASHRSVFSLRADQDE